MNRVVHKKPKVFLGFKMLHIALSILIFYGAWILFRYGSLFVIIREKGFRYNYLVAILYIVALTFFVRTYNAYLVGYSRIRTLTIAQFISQLFSGLLVYIMVSISWVRCYNPIWLVAGLFIQGVLDCVWSFLVSRYFFRVNLPKRTILIYRNEFDKKRFGAIVGKPVGMIYNVVKEQQYNGDDFLEIKDRLNGYEAIFVAGINSQCRNGIMKYCAERNIPGFFLPHIGDILMKGAKHIQTLSAPVHYFSYKQNRPEYLFAKRVIDIVASLCSIVVLSPITILTALAIKLYDHGPVIYRQTRLTKGGKEFEILKFRSMRVDAEKDGIARLSTGDNDDRITPIGRMIRKCRFDELPQLFNILKGEMSIVGPRPERPEIAEQYYEVLPEFKLRLQVKAGLTGYAQVYGKYNLDPYEKLQFDLLYINNMSLLTDINLILATFSILFVGESTEGIELSQITAVGQKRKR